MFNVFAFGENVPVPLVLHVPPVALVTIPIRGTLETLAHTVVSLLPTKAAGRLPKSISIVLETALQIPSERTVRVIFADPLLTSWAVGEYVVERLAAFENVPPFPPLHNTEEAWVAFPKRFTVVVLAQIS